MAPGEKCSPKLRNHNSKVLTPKNMKPYILIFWDIVRLIEMTATLL